MGLAGCVSSGQPVQPTSQQKEVIDLKNGYTTEEQAFRFLQQEAKKLEGTTRSANGHEINIGRAEALYLICRRADGIFSYQDSDYHVSLEEIKELIYRNQR